MAGPFYQRSYVRGDIGTEFFYDGAYTLDRDGDSGAEIAHDIPTGQTEGGHGEYQADASLASRVFSIKGTLVGEDHQDLQAKRDQLLSEHPVGPLGKFRVKLVDGASVITDRYLPCRVSGRTPGHRHSAPFARWEIAFRTGSPQWRDWTAQSPASLTVGAGTAITAGGTEWTEPSIALAVTTTGRVTVSVTVGGVVQSSMAFNAITMGTWTIDSENRRLIAPSGANSLAQIVSGGWLAISPQACTVTVTASSGAVLSGATATWRCRWANAG